jgi:ribosomal peptide maturation radical SAM protein 1
MPFVPLLTPSLGLSLLKGSLQAQGIPSRIFYFHLRFAKQVGPRLYEFISSSSAGVMSLSGEWLFSHTLFENKPDDVNAYVTQILRKQRPEDSLPWGEMERFIAELLIARMGISAFVDQCVDAILETGANIVGFTSVFQQNVGALAVAQRLKRRRPEIITVFGGANFEGPMGREQFERFPFIDVAFSGESEQRFPWVVERLRKGERLGKLMGVMAREHLLGGPAFESEGEPMLRELDRLPVPDFSDYFAQWEEARLPTSAKPSLLFETSRGCWWGQKQHCTFCGLNGESMEYRSKSPQRALSEFTTLIESHPGLSVSVVDNILDMKYFKTFIQELGARANPVELFYEVKANLSKEQIRQLKAARVLRIQPGIESLSDQALKIMRKGITALQNLQLMKWCKEFGVTPFWFMLWGFPGENPAEYAKVAELIPLITHLMPPMRGVSIVMERFSPNFNQSQALGFRNVRPAPAYSFLYDLPEEALRNIAYYFSYEHADDRNVWAYAKPVAERIVQWQAEHADAALYSLDKQDHVVIFDRRKVAPSARVVLQGADRWALLACDGVTSLTALKSRYPEEATARGWDPLEAVLSRLVDAKLLLTDGKAYLGLPVAVTQEPFVAADDPRAALGATG